MIENAKESTPEEELFDRKEMLDTMLADQERVARMIVLFQHNRESLQEILKMNADMSDKNAEAFFKVMMKLIKTWASGLDDVIEQIRASDQERVPAVIKREERH